MTSKKRTLPSGERLIWDEFIYGTIKEIEQFLGGNLQLSSEEMKNSSEVSFHSSEVLFHSSEVLFHSSEVLFRPSVENFHLLPRDFQIPREKLKSAEM
ncbi:hypothetical protein [Porphyromonas uenonis]|uniref:hypothetical protein n=1 Tax=Porphyromonas uenonis TaxID=281920 RepID=UPI0026EED94E|nr:hypothetical protein [Porphyromonas uenonis]